MTTEAQTQRSSDVANTSQEVVKTESIEKPKRTRQKCKTAETKTETVHENSGTASVEVVKTESVEKPKRTRQKRKTAVTKTEPVHENSGTAPVSNPTENDQSNAGQNQEPTNGPDTSGRKATTNVMDFEAHGPMSVDRYLHADDEGGENNSPDAPVAGGGESQNTISSELKSNEGDNSVQNSTERETNELSHDTEELHENEATKTRAVEQNEESVLDDNENCTASDNMESRSRERSLEGPGEVHKTTGNSREANSSPGFLRSLLDLRFAIVYVFLLILIFQNVTIPVDFSRELVGKLSGILSINSGSEFSSIIPATGPDATLHSKQELPSSPIMFEKGDGSDSTRSIDASAANQFRVPNANISENSQSYAVPLTKELGLDSGNATMVETGSSNTEVFTEMSIPTPSRDIETASTVSSDSSSGSDPQPVNQLNSPQLSTLIQGQSDGEIMEPTAMNNDSALMNGNIVDLSNSDSPDVVRNPAGRNPTASHGIISASSGRVDRQNSNCTDPNASICQNVASEHSSVSGNPFAANSRMAVAMELLTEKLGERNSFNENDIGAFLEITGQEFANLALDEETSNGNYSNGNEIVLHFVAMFNEIASQLGRQYGLDIITENSENNNSNSVLLRKSWNIIDGTNLAGISHDGQIATLKLEEHYMNVSKGDSVPNAGLVVEISENGEFWEVRTSTGNVFRTKFPE